MKDLREGKDVEFWYQKAQEYRRQLGGVNGANSKLKQKLKEKDADIPRLKAEVVSLMQKKQPYTFDPEAPIENIRTVCRYIDELTAERDEWRDRAEGSSKVQISQSNLEWLLCESAFRGKCMMAMYSALHYLPETPWNSFAEFSNWLMAPHEDAEREDANYTNAKCDDSGENVEREKLKADLKTLLYEFGRYCFDSREEHTDNVDTFFEDFVSLLDRAAITKGDSA